MKLTLGTGAVTTLALFVQFITVPFSAKAQSNDVAWINKTGIRRVLLISVGGMHALDFANCAKGLSSIDGGTPGRREKLLFSFAIALSK